MPSTAAMQEEEIGGTVEEVVVVVAAAAAAEVAVAVVDVDVDVDAIIVGRSTAALFGQSQSRRAALTAATSRTGNAESPPSLPAVAPLSCVRAALASLSPSRTARRGRLMTA